MTTPNCDTCQHAHPVIEDITINGTTAATPTVQCRRHPPVVVVIQHREADHDCPQLHSEWPLITASDSWCSEYNRKTTP